MVEWFKALVLKTIVLKNTVGSNPSLSFERLNNIIGNVIDCCHTDIQRLVISDINIGVLYLFAISSLSVYGIVLARVGQVIPNTLF